MGGGAFLSIVIPVYNREKFIRKCLDSIVNQPVDFSVYEIICIDDGSVDNSLSILKEYEKNFPHIKVFSQENQGASSARNHGIDKAVGKYIWFIDSDDYLYENTLNKLLLTMFQANEEIYVFPYWEINDTEIKQEKGDFVAVHDASWGNIVLTKIIKENNIRFNQDMTFGEDMLFWHQVYIHCYVLVCYVARVYNYRIHEDSIMNKITDENKALKRYNDTIILIKSLAELIRVTQNKNKIKHLKTKKMELIQKLLLEVVPYCGLSYKEAMGRLKKEKIYPYLFNSKVFKAIFTVKRFKYKLANFILWLFPIEMIYKMYYKKIIKNKKISG